MLIHKRLKTSEHTMFYEITDEIQAAVTETKITEGFAIVYCPHTTAGITINENADPDVVTDMIRRFDEVYPWSLDKDRHMEGNTAAHMKASTVGASEMVIINNGKLSLGTWQGIYFCEFDGPRHRSYTIKLITG
ncbi:secondary thiamine-phosphate synthase enzyme YjbQ [Niallia taxi]|uniref:secondary thiamine-phosphate synthase enzyme YjbQ n=1 Tax=Niallia taxi TaxID=2499688 RepID=UPI0021A4C09C|nr:secondary thiamine-phosphate synthase enzyme YjbQ [Niallia taxi]MCT2343869.1 secondary thiamine-phosphate synthase enzyme YjbQ [Niallia taxi]MDE5051889.1 secondary thiamine-phosphate synthase enzyme YjbQ [Niallia taxi]WOD61672.1 secondary thiamine-phosphate synthase enzyme YjbQ [Niallia taxi]